MRFNRKEIATILEIAATGSPWMHINVSYLEEDKVSDQSQTRYEKFAEVLTKGGWLFCDDDESSKRYIFYLTDLQRGWKKFKEDYPEEAERIENEDADANDCDIFMQYVLFGEYVYG